MGKEYFEGICHVLHFEEEKETGKTQEGQNRHYKQYSERGKPGERVLKPCSPVTCSVACRNGALLLSGSHCPHPQNEGLGNMPSKAISSAGSIPCSDQLHPYNSCNPSNKRVTCISVELCSF